MTEPFVLTISPPQPCMGGDPDTEGTCQFLTTLAEVEHESDNERQLRLMPYCWKHLYLGFPERDEGPTPEELELMHFSIRNFVLGHFGGVGTVEILGPCPVDSIPKPYERDTIDNYETEEEKERFLMVDMDDDAWYVLYRDPEGQERRVCAVYLMWENWWELYEFPASTD